MALQANSSKVVLLPRFSVACTAHIVNEDLILVEVGICGGGRGGRDGNCEDEGIMVV